MFGNENQPKDVLEYVVFERVLTYAYSQWRVHSKIVPSWLPASSPILYTFEKPKISTLTANSASTPIDGNENEQKRDKIAQEHDIANKRRLGANEQAKPLPTISDISQANKKRTVGYT
jgi:hypothetical protein